MKSKYKSVQGLANGVRYALRRQGIPVSVWWDCYQAHKTDGIHVTVINNEIVIEPYRCDVSMHEVLIALQREGYNFEVRQQLVVGGVGEVTYFLNGREFL